MSELPTGTVTFLFTGIKPARLLHDLGRKATRRRRHRRVLREGVAASVEVDTQGDAFASPSDRSGGGSPRQPMLRRHLRRTVQRRGGPPHTGAAR
jgi:hypothetical protein